MMWILQNCEDSRCCVVPVKLLWRVHNLLMMGPPGSGKTMAAKRIPTILPELSREEKLELSQIYSLCGLLDQERIIQNERPFRSPHHTVTAQALVGGGKQPHPGEISLAHHGILFLDELAEFKPGILDVLREPLEEKKVHISRWEAVLCIRQILCLWHRRIRVPVDFIPI